MFVSHVLYGLRLAADIALPGLPRVSNSDLFDVQVRLKDRNTFAETFSEPSEIFYPGLDDAAHGPPTLRVGVFPGGDYFGFFYRDGVRFAVDRRGLEVWADWPENYTLEDACTYLVGPVMGFVLLLRGLTCLHASAVAVDDRAIALVGFPGAGKSTTAAAFARRGYAVIADDVVALANDGGRFVVPPGYPRVNLWPDSVRSLFGSEEALPRITPTWDKRYLPLGDNGFAFAAKPLPLRAIYLLGAREAELAAPAVQEVAGSDALAGLVANTYVNYLLDSHMRSREFDVLSRVSARIPIRRVRPPADPSAVFDLCEAIAADARQVMVDIPKRATSRHD